MFRWLINKVIRVELDDLDSKMRKHEARLAILEDRFKYLQGKLYRGKSPKPRRDDEEEDDEEEDPALSKLTPEMRAFYEQTVEYQQMQKLKNMASHEEE